METRTALFAALLLFFMLNQVGCQFTNNAQWKPFGGKRDLPHHLMSPTTVSSPMVSICSCDSESSIKLKDENCYHEGTSGWHGIEAEHGLHAHATLSRLVVLDDGGSRSCTAYAVSRTIDWLETAWIDHFASLLWLCRAPITWREREQFYPTTEIKCWPVITHAYHTDCCFSLLSMR